MRRPQSLMRGEEMACASAQKTVPEHLPGNRHLARTGKVLSWTVDAHDAYQDSTQCSNDERSNFRELVSSVLKNSISFSSKFILSKSQWHYLRPLLKRGSEPRFEGYRRKISGMERKI